MSNNTGQNISIAKFYNDLAECRQRLLDLAALGSYLECPDMAMIDKLDNAARSIARHLDTYKLQVSGPNNENPDVPL